MKRIIALTLILTMIFSTQIMCFAVEENITVTVDFGGESHKISPYIYGINDWTYYEDATSIRQGGNRYTGYNWETNFSNAGSDWYHSSDMYLPDTIPSKYRNTPACMATWLSDVAKGKYKVVTLQMAGYVSADKNGKVSETEVAPSSRWVEVKSRKNSAFSLTPDLNDGCVYMDEYVNYLVKTLGNAKSENGINGYMLDNEPGLWVHTHSKIHPNQVTYKELVEKSVDLASAVKDVDPDAEIFGPALFGLGAFMNLCDAPDEDGSYDWFISYYLDKMRDAENQYGKRLLDVLDIHYYSEATGEHRITNCNENDTKCVEARVQAVRTLDEEGYYENSWIGKWAKGYLPILSKVKKSVDKYYPGTKISISEYSFGGGNSISGAIAQADALGTFARNDIYLATLWDKGEYQKSAISLYTNFDGNGGEFGDTYIPSTSSNIELTSCYAAKHSDSDKANVILTNKSLDKEEKITLKLSNSDKNYIATKVWAITDGSPDIKFLNAYAISDNEVEITLPALSVANVVLVEEQGSSDGKIKGDINSDKTLDVIDVALLRAHIVGNKRLTKEESEIADMNNDSNTDIIDVVMMRKEIVYS